MGGEFSNIRALRSQMALDLQVRSGRVSAAFRRGIRAKLLEIAGPQREAVIIRIEQISTGGTAISIQIDDWVEETDRRRIERGFKDFMDSIGATTSGACSGQIRGPLVTLLNQNL
jgi:hypothetical protein